MTAFGPYATYYDLLYHDKDYAAETAFVISLLQRHSHGATDILELGCGTGIHALALAAAGYRVDGVDISRDMLAVAEQRRASAAAPISSMVHLTHGDIRSFSCDKIYGAVTSLFHVMSYQTNDRDLTLALAAARRHVAKGSPFVFDFWYGPAVLFSGPLRRSKVAENDRYRVIRTTVPQWYPERDLVQVHFDIAVTDKMTGTTQEFEETHDLRYFFVDRLERELNASGFRLDECGEWLTGRAPAADSFSTYIVAVAE
jgi:SAM-dependent methyltransferase